MTARAGIWDLQCFGNVGRDELERVAPYVHVTQSLLDLGHVTGDAFAAWRTGFMMRVVFDRRSFRAVR